MAGNQNINWHRQRTGLIVLAILSLMAAGASLWGTRDTWTAPTAARVSDGTDAGTTVEDVDLPFLANRSDFQASCTICHSARLPMTQPKLAGEKWKEIVHKMVAAYGAPITPIEEGRIIEYLLAAQQSRFGISDSSQRGSSGDASRGG